MTVGAADRMEVVVDRVRNETPDINSYVLTQCDGGPLPAFRAGAHIDVEPVPGVVRQYSIVSAPSDRGRYVIGVKREANGRGGSSAMHAAVREGMVLSVSPPKNNFAIRTTAGRSVLLAGGIGVTPLLSMAQALDEGGAAFELHYFARSNNEIAFRDLVAQAAWVHRVHFHFGLVPPVLNDVLGDILRQPDRCDHIYLCGPVPFMDTVRDVAAAAGWPADNVNLEHFSAVPPELPDDGESFVVRLAKRDLELVVPPDKTIIEVLRDADVEIATSCEQGVCGTCVTPVVEGDPDHHDLFLSDEEREKEHLFTPCVSRSKSKLLVIDL